MAGLFFLFMFTATAEIYTLSLHDALPICAAGLVVASFGIIFRFLVFDSRCADAIAFIASFAQDRKSTRLNSSHITISYAVFCLKKKILPAPVRLLLRSRACRCFVSLRKTE